MFRPGKISPLAFALAIPLLVIGFAAIVIFSRKFGGVKADPFPYANYKRDPESLRGNAYLVRAQIDSRIAYTDGVGGLFAVRLLDASEGRLPVFIAEAVGGNIEIGQRYDILVEVRRDRLVAKSMTKM